MMVGLPLSGNTGHLLCCCGQDLFFLKGIGDYTAIQHGRSKLEASQRWDRTPHERDFPISMFVVFDCVCAHQLIAQQPTITRVKELRLTEYASIFDTGESSAIQFVTNLLYCCSKAVYVVALPI